MSRTICRRAASALILAAALAAGCGGGGGGGTLSFTVVTVNPDTSVDLNGGDDVTITGTNFVAADVRQVNFGATPGLSFDRVNDTTITVVSPPAPGGVAGTIDLELISLNAGSRLVLGAFTYSGTPPGPPSPQTITPTTYTPSGAEAFTIGGTSLGPSGGTVTVSFGGFGDVSGTVNNDATLVTGRAPILSGIVNTSPITVTVRNGAQTGDVPTQVSFAWAAPQTLPVPGQSALPGESSQPVLVGPGLAALCTAGFNGAWGDSDDEIVLVSGPPGTPGANRITVGFLDRRNSVPAVLNSTSFVVYSPGLIANPFNGDELMHLVTGADTATPTVTQLSLPFPNTAPLVAVSSTRVAYVSSGVNPVMNSGDEELHVVILSGTTIANTLISSLNGALVDTTPGAANFSLPFSADGNLVYVASGGPNGTIGDFDDALHGYAVNTQTALSAAPAANLFGRPIATSGTVIAAAGASGVAGNDALNTWTVTGTTISRTQVTIGTTVNGAAIRPFAASGTGIAIATTGGNLTPGDGDDLILIYPDPTVNAPLAQALPGRPLLTPLGSGDLVAFGPGPDNVFSSGDEQVRRFLPDGSFAGDFTVAPIWPFTPPPGTDATRAFAIGAGGDAAFGTNDDVLIVHQTLALAAGVDTSLLPVHVGAGAFVTGGLPFLPIGPGWGLVQSPGLNGFFGGTDDQLILARY